MFPRIIEAAVLRQTRNRELADQYVNKRNGTLDLEQIDGRLWSTVLHFLENPWFRRIWDIQEAVLARNLMFLSGDYQIPSGLYADLMACPALGEPGNRFDHFRRVPVSNWVFRMRERRLRALGFHFTDNVCLLMNDLHFLSTNHAYLKPEDRILGLLGFIEDANSQPFDLDTLLSIEYATNLCTHFSTTLSTNASFDGNDNMSRWLARAFVQREKRPMSLPPWVPDFH